MSGGIVASGSSRCGTLALHEVRNGEILQMDGSTESGSSTHDVLEIWPRRSWRTDRPASFTVKKLRWLREISEPYRPLPGEIGTRK